MFFLLVLENYHNLRQGGYSDYFNNFYKYNSNNRGQIKNSYTRAYVSDWLYDSVKYFANIS